MSSNLHSTNLVSLYKSRVNLLAMLGAQGYDPSHLNEFSINEIHAMHANKQLDFVLNGPGTKKVRVIYHTQKNLRPQHVYDMVEQYFVLENVLSEDDPLIIITKDPANDTMMSTLKSISAQYNILVIVYGLNQLQFNVLEHSLVPTHEKLSLEEVSEFKKRFFINRDSQIPTISRFDPVAQAIGLKPGDICKITRPSRTSVTGDYYRMCINK